jgi:hypothetical protein
MENKLLQILAEYPNLHITRLLGMMPEIKGEYAVFMSTNEGLNPNILWLDGVSQDFIRLFNRVLIDDKSIMWQPEDIDSFIWSQSPVYVMTIATRRLIKGVKHCWLPISLKLSDEQIK